MKLTKHIRLLTFCALVSITALNAKSTISIVKGGAENGRFPGDVFFWWWAKIAEAELLLY